MKKHLWPITSAACVALLAMFFAVPPVSAETETQASASANEANDPNAEILQELERMRARIQELESRLRQQANAKAESDKVGVAAQSTQQFTAAPAAAPVEASAAQMPQADPGETKKAEPFAFADWTWLNGTPRTKTPAFDSKFFTPEIRADVDFIYDFHHPKDDTISGSSEVFRSNEIQVTQLGVGGDFHYDNVRARLMTQFGMYSTTTPRNDASPSRGQWNLADAYRYLTEAYGGYHFNALHGINVDAGIFMSYV